MGVNGIWRGNIFFNGSQWLIIVDSDDSNMGGLLGNLQYNRLQAQHMFVFGYGSRLEISRHEWFTSHCINTLLPNRGFLVAPFLSQSQFIMMWVAVPVEISSDRMRYQNFFYMFHSHLHTINTYLKKTKNFN